MKLHEAQEAIEGLGVEQIQRSLRSWRETVGLNALDLAKLSGVPQSNIHRIEDGKQSVTPRVFARLITAIEKKSQKRINELEKENSVLRGLQEATARVALCKSLPWMVNELPKAEAALSEKKAEAARLSGKDSISDPVVRLLMESYKREIEQLEKAGKAYFNILGQIAGKATMHFTAAVLRGDQWAVDEYEHYEKTGETSLTVVLDAITPKVEK